MTIPVDPFILEMEIHYMPVEVDVLEIVSYLNTWGWKDQKIEVICGFSAGYISKLRDGARPNRPHQHVGRLWNFWMSEIERRKGEWSASRQTLVVTTT